MLDTFRLLAATAVAVTLMSALGNSQPATAQAAAKQIKLTEKQVEGFIAAQKKLAEAKTDAESETVAKEHGFAGLPEYEDVEASIVLVMKGIDPQTKAFVEPQLRIKRRIDDVKSDKSMPEAERKQALAELDGALKDVQPVQFPANIDLVRKYFDKILPALE